MLTALLDASCLGCDAM